MGAFSFERFNGIARSSLDKLLFDDLWNHDIFNERDMHSSAYFYIRDYFRKHSRDNIYVRCEANLGGLRPDIVIYERGNPIYVLEFKFFSKPDYVNVDSVMVDLAKLTGCVETFPSVRWGFLFMIYDADESYGFSDAKLRRQGFSKISVSPINARRSEGSGRRRVGYDDWRNDYDRLRTSQREHA